MVAQCVLGGHATLKLRVRGKPIEGYGCSLLLVLAIEAFGLDYRSQDEALPCAQVVSTLGGTCDSIVASFRVLDPLVRQLLERRALANGVLTGGNHPLHASEAGDLVADEVGLRGGESRLHVAL